MESITLIENEVPLTPITTDQLGRIRLSMEHKEALLDAFERSAMSGLGFARKYGLNLLHVCLVGSQAQGIAESAAH